MVNAEPVDIPISDPAFIINYTIQHYRPDMVCFDIFSLFFYFFQKNESLPFELKL